MPDTFLACRDYETFVRVDLALLAVALEHPDVGAGRSVGAGARLVEVSLVIWSAIEESLTLITTWVAMSDSALEMARALDAAVEDLPPAPSFRLITSYVTWRI
jgi:hypothetical protein